MKREDSWKQIRDTLVGLVVGGILTTLGYTYFTKPTNDIRTATTRIIELEAAQNALTAKVVAHEELVETIVRIDERLKRGDPNNLLGAINRNSELLTAFSEQVRGVEEQLNKRFGELTARFGEFTIFIRGLHKNEQFFPGDSACALIFQDESRLAAVTRSDTPGIARLVVDSPLAIIPVGSPVQGKVVSTFVDETMCRQVIVAHDLGFRTQFGHLRAEDKFKKVKVGDVLEHGDILGVIKASSPAWVTATVFLPGKDTPLHPGEFFPSLQAPESYQEKPK